MSVYSRRGKVVTEREACKVLTSASLGILEVNRPHSSKISEASEWALFCRHCPSPWRANLSPYPASLLNNTFTASPVSGSRPLFPCPTRVICSTSTEGHVCYGFYFFIISIIIITLDRVSWSPDRLQTCLVARDDLVLLVLLPPLTNC